MQYFRQNIVENRILYITTYSAERTINTISEETVETRKSYDRVFKPGLRKANEIGI